MNSVRRDASWWISAIKLQCKHALATGVLIRGETYAKRHDKSWEEFCDNPLGFKCDNRRNA